MPKAQMTRPSASKMSSYDKVPTSEEKDTNTATNEEQNPSNQQQQQQSIGCWELYLRGGRLTPDQKAALASRKQLQDEGAAPATVEFRLHPESIRQLAYAAFWSMCLLAVLLTKMLIPSEVIEDSDLKAVFGYNNVSSIVVLHLLDLCIEC